MRNTFGQNLTLTLFGESHGPAVGAVLDGLSPGIPVSEEEIASRLAKRRPDGAAGTARREADRFQIVSGVFSGRTTGTPLCILIPNEDVSSSDYESWRGLARPGHADYSAFCKYHGFEDYRGGGHFSGRLTAALVAAGGILIPALSARGIRIGSHILRCAGIQDRSFSDPGSDFDALEEAPFPVLDPSAAERIRAAVEAAGAEGDSVGGVSETAVTGVPAGIGEPWFDTLEGVLAHALFSSPAVKGVSFGDAASMTDAKGSEWNDLFRAEGTDIVTETNHNGGINGGISNGMPLRFSCIVKPTPSVAVPQKTVDFRDGSEAVLQIRGRHDPSVLPRAIPVLNSVTALVLADFLIGRFGTDCLRYETK